MGRVGLGVTSAAAVQRDRGPRQQPVESMVPPVLGTKIAVLAWCLSEQLGRKRSEQRHAIIRDISANAFCCCWDICSELNSARQPVRDTPRPSIPHFFSPTQVNQALQELKLWTPNKSPALQQR
eukprot:1149143-Pelagomonas_calceolata.AAC.6